MSKINKKCEVCDKLFSYYNTTSPNRRFCSKICDSIAKRTERIGMTFSEKHKNNLSKSHMGNSGYWTGKKRSQETIEKFRISHIDKKLSKETIEKKRLSMLGKHIGDKNPMWNGGTAKNNYPLEFKRMRHQIREHDNYTCQLCFQNDILPSD